MITYQCAVQRLQCHVKVCGVQLARGCQWLQQYMCMFACCYILVLIRPLRLGSYPVQCDKSLRTPYPLSRFLGTRLILGVDLTDTWCRFALWLPGLHPGSPTTHSFLPSFAMPGCTCILHSYRIIHSLFGVGKTFLALQSTQPSSTPNSCLLQFCCISPFGSWEGQPWSKNLCIWACTVSLLGQVLICLTV